MPPVIDAIARSHQFAAIVVEFGGALAIALLFAVMRRYVAARGYLAWWTVAWSSAAVGLAAVALRYVLLGDGPSARPDGSIAVHLLYAVYQAGKITFWTTLCLGAFEYARPEERFSRWWAAVAVVFGLATGLSTELSTVLVWQAPVAIAACVLGAFALLDLPERHRGVGSLATGTVFAATAVLWVAYLFAFASIQHFIPDIAPAFAGRMARYNSNLDTLTIAVLGYAMIVLIMEDVRLRSADAESRLAALVTTTTEAILTLDADLRIVDANAAAQRMFALDGAAVRGCALESLVEAADAERLRSSLDALRHGSAASAQLDGEAALRCLRGGTSFPCELSASPIRAGGEAVIALVMRDATERRQAEERRLQSSKMDAVRQLAGGLAHDFNNLLTAIVGRSQILLRTIPADSATRHGIEEIERTASAAARLTHGLLALSRLDPLHPDRLPANALVRALETKVRAVAGAGVSVECRFADDVGEVHVDVARFHDVMLAVIQNAREAMGAAGGRIVIETSRLGWHRSPGVLADTACITVRDSGPGMTPEARTHLFEPFFSTKGEGRGLGLATAYAFMQQSGGSLDVQSSSFGTTVRLAIPLHGDAVATRLREGPLAPGQLRRAARPTALVVEDEETVRRFVRIVLEQEGIRVIEATNGLEALDVFAAADPPVDVLLTDVVMPQMGGAELAERLQVARPGLRVVLMSGFVRDIRLRDPATGRALPFLQKPFDIEDLSRVVRSELNRG